MVRVGVQTRAMRFVLLVIPGVVVIVCVLVTAVIAASVQERSIRETTAERIYRVASSISELHQVGSVLERGRAEESDPERPRSEGFAAEVAELQSVADLVEQAAGVDYVVITDTSGIRLTHPRPEQRGVLVRTDTSPLRNGVDFIGTATGPTGRTLRAKVPVEDEAGAITGMVAVGMLESHITEDLDEALRELVPWAAGALILGTLASSLLSYSFHRRFRRADEAVRELDAVTRTATALQEQAHEFHTRLHVIHGLVSHGDAPDALAYIAGIAPMQADAHSDGLSHQPLLRATVDALRAELSAMGVSLEFSADVDTEVDAAVTLVLANLCRNAGEAGASHVVGTLVERDGFFTGRVDDDGPGVDQHHADRIFTRGYSSKHEHRRRGRQSGRLALGNSWSRRGIGLSLVRRTVAIRQGSVEVGRSEAGGARFLFEMQVRSR